MEFFLKWPIFMLTCTLKEGIIHILFVGSSLLVLTRTKYSLLLGDGGAVSAFSTPRRLYLVRVFFVDEENELSKSFDAN